MADCPLSKDWETNPGMEKVERRRKPKPRVRERVQRSAFVHVSPLSPTLSPARGEGA